MYCVLLMLLIWWVLHRTPSAKPQPLAAVLRIFASAEGHNLSLAPV
jgi:hypothetical protein